MSQNLATYSIRQMPQITCPNLLDMDMVTKLTTDRFYEAPNAFTDSQLPSIKVGRTAILGWNRKLKCLLLKKLLLERLGQIRSVGQQQAAVTGGQLAHHMQVMDVGRGQIERLNHTDGADLEMQPKAIKSLATKLFTVGRNASKKLAAAGSGKSTDRYRQAVQHRDRISEIPGNMFKKSLFKRPQIRGLPHETDPTTEIGKVVVVESLEEFKDGLIGVQTEDFPDDFHGNHFAISHLWRRTSLAQGPFGKEFFHKIISFAEDIYDKIIKVHFLALNDQWNFCFDLLNSIGQRAFFISVHE